MTDINKRCCTEIRAEKKQTKQKQWHQFVRCERNIVGHFTVQATGQTLDYRTLLVGLEEECEKEKFDRY